MAIVLLSGLVAYQSADIGSTPLSDVTLESQLRARIASFQRVIAARDAINAAYFDAVGPYAEAMAAVGTLMPKGGDPKGFAEKVVREKIAALGPVRDLTVNSGEISRHEDGIAEVPVSLSFVSGSQTALALVGVLGRPEQGVAWDELTLTPDARARSVQVAGRVTALVIEEAE